MRQGAADEGLRRTLARHAPAPANGCCDCRSWTPSAGHCRSTRSGCRSFRSTTTFAPRRGSTAASLATRESTRPPSPSRGSPRLSRRAGDFRPLADAGRAAGTHGCSGGRRRPDRGKSLRTAPGPAGILDPGRPTVQLVPANLGRRGGTPARRRDRRGGSRGGRRPGGYAPAAGASGRLGAAAGVDGPPGPAASLQCHLRLDLFAGPQSPHPAAAFGCTACHEGQGSATEFRWASHTPNTPADRDRWRRQHGWFCNADWEFPLRPARFIQSSCLKCHHEVSELEPSAFRDPPAPKLLAGYQLIRENGCFGCHEIRGVDESQARFGPDMPDWSPTTTRRPWSCAEPGLTRRQRAWWSR